MDGLALYYYALQQGINIVPGLLFGEDRRYNNCIRLNAGHELSAEIQQAIKIGALGEAWALNSCAGECILINGA